MLGFISLSLVLDGRERGKVVILCILKVGSPVSRTMGLLKCVMVKGGTAILQQLADEFLKSSMESYLAHLAVSKKDVPSWRAIAREVWSERQGREQRLLII